MKNKKFSIEVIEEGRLNRNESNEIVGGAKPKVCDPYFCSELAVACSAIYTNCSGDNFRECYVGDNSYGACVEQAYWHCFADTTVYKKRP